MGFVNKNIFPYEIRSQTPIQFILVNRRSVNEGPGRNSCYKIFYTLPKHLTKKRGETVRLNSFFCLFIVRNKKSEDTFEYIWMILSRVVLDIVNTKIV